MCVASPKTLREFLLPPDVRANKFSKYQIPLAEPASECSACGCENDLPDEILPALPFPGCVVEQVNPKNAGRPAVSLVNLG